VHVALWHRGHMDEHQLSDGQLAAIFLEGAYRHEQALAACLEEVGDLARLEDGDSRQLLDRALLHAERAAACAADAANVADSSDAQLTARRSLAVGRLAVYALRHILGQDEVS